MVDTRQVRNFLAVVEHGGFGRAAAALELAQPTLSQSVRALERDLGAALFHRASRGVLLSAAGRAFLGPARQLLRDAAAVTESTGGRGERAVLELVAAAPLAAHPGAGLVGSFVAAHPDVLVRLDRVPDRGGVEDALWTQVRDGVSELGLVYLPMPRRGLAEVELGEHRFAMAFPPGTRLPEGPLPLSALAGQAVLAGPRGSSLRDFAESALRSAGVRPRLVVECAQRDALLSLVLAGAGAGFVSGGEAAAAEAGGAVIRHLDPMLRLPYGLVHRPVELSPAAAAFVALARG